MLRTQPTLIIIISHLFFLQNEIFFLEKNFRDAKLLKSVYIYCFLTLNLMFRQVTYFLNYIEIK